MKEYRKLLILKTIYELLIDLAELDRLAAEELQDTLAYFYTD